jgi:hypothetical protein
MAAKMGPEADRMVFLEQAVHWRRLAHEMQMERFGPLGSANMFTGDVHPEPGDDPEPTAD